MNVTLLLLLLAVISFAQVPSYVPTNGLVGWWPFNGNANDESGNGNNGTVNGATLTSDRFGNTGKAYDFDGADDYLDFTNTSSIINFSCSFWFSADTLIQIGPQNIGQKLISKFSNSQAFPNGWEIEINANGNVTYGNGTQYNSSLVSYNTRTWNYIVIT